MCGRYELSSHPAAIALAFGLPHPPDLAPRYNIAPDAAGADRPAECSRRARARAGALGARAALGEGSVDRRADDQRARRDARRLKSAFRNAYARHRCLLPVNGFYEWQRDAGRQAADAHRHAGRPARSGSPACTSAGCRRTAKCSTRARSSRRRRSDALRDVHDRMPVIVPPPRITRAGSTRRTPTSPTLSRRGPASHCASTRCRRASTPCATTMRRSAIRSTSRPAMMQRWTARSRSCRSCTATAFRGFVRTRRCAANRRLRARDRIINGQCIGRQRAFPGHAFARAIPAIVDCDQRPFGRPARFSEDPGRFFGVAAEVDQRRGRRDCAIGDPAANTRAIRGDDLEWKRALRQVRRGRQRLRKEDESLLQPPRRRAHGDRDRSRDKKPFHLACARSRASSHHGTRARRRSMRRCARARRPSSASGCRSASRVMRPPAGGSPPASRRSAPPFRAPCPSAATRCLPARMLPRGTSTQRAAE